MKNIIILLVTGSFLIVSACSNEQSQRNAKNVVTEESSSVETDPSATSADYKVTFVELGSVRCIPCRMMQPIMDEIQKEYIGQVKVVFHDVWTEEGRPYAEKYRIRSIPTQIFLDKDGNEYYRHIGFFPKKELIAVLKKQGVK